MIADNYLQLRTELETALSKLLRLNSEMRRDPATLDTLHGLLTDIREPLLFVVVLMAISFGEDGCGLVQVRARALLCPVVG